MIGEHKDPSALDDLIRGLQDHPDRFVRGTSTWALIGLGVLQKRGVAPESARR